MLLQDPYSIPQFYLLKWGSKLFHVWEDPGYLVRGRGHFFVVRGKLTSYTWVLVTMCTLSYITSTIDSADIESSFLYESLMTYYVIPSINFL